MQYNSMQWGSEIAPDTFSFGIDKPVVHQSSVVLNAVASLQLGRLRKRPDGGHKRFALDGPGVFAVQRHELAFRDTRPAVMASRRRPLNVSDVEIFTSFNYLTTDSEPVFMGVVDLPRNTDGVDSNKREDSTVVAIHGTRSTIHTGRDIIRPGDSVYWDFPRARTSALDSSQVPAVHIRGMPQNKFLAETRPMNYQSDGGISLYRNVASLLNGSFRRGNDVLPGDRPSAAEQFLQAAVALVGGPAYVYTEGVSVPDIPPSESKRMEGGLAQGVSPNAIRLIMELARVASDHYHQVNKRRIGIAINTAAQHGKLDLYVRGGSTAY